YCTELMRWIYRDWLPNDGARTQRVVIAGRWEESDIEPLKRTLAYLRSLGKQVVLYGPSPENLLHVQMILAYEHILPVDLQARLVKAERLALDAKFKTIFAQDAVYFSPVDSVCTGGKCQLLRGGAPIFFDRDHFTQPGAKWVIRDFP